MYFAVKLIKESRSEENISDKTKQEKWWRAAELWVLDPKNNPQKQDDLLCNFRKHSRICLWNSGDKSKKVPKAPRSKTGPVEKVLWGVQATCLLYTSRCV